MQNEKGQLVIVSRPNQQQTQMRPNLNQPNQQRPQQLRPNSVPIVAAQTGTVTSSSNRASQMLPQQKIVASRSKTNVIMCRCALCHSFVEFALLFQSFV